MHVNCRLLDGSCFDGHVMEYFDLGSDGVAFRLSLAAPTPGGESRATEMRSAVGGTDYWTLYNMRRGDLGTT